MSYREIVKVPWTMLKINVQDQITALEKSIKVWSFIVEKTAEIINFCEVDDTLKGIKAVRTFLSTQVMPIPSLVQEGVVCTEFTYSMILCSSIKSILIEHMFREKRVCHDCHCCEYGDSLGLNNTSSEYCICNVCPAKGFWNKDDLDVVYFACEKEDSPYNVWCEAKDAHDCDFSMYNVRMKSSAAKRVVEVLENALKNEKVVDFR